MGGVLLNSNPLGSGPGYSDCPFAPPPALSALTHPVLSSSQLLERLLSRRRLQGGEPGGVAGGLGGCSQLTG